MDRYSIAVNKPDPIWSPLLESNRRIINTGEPCGLHRNCLSHTHSPCEGCGRIAGQGDIVVDMEDLT